MLMMTMAIVAAAAAASTCLFYMLLMKPLKASQFIYISSTNDIPASKQNTTQASPYGAENESARIAKGNLLRRQAVRNSNNISASIYKNPQKLDCPRAL